MLFRTSLRAGPAALALAALSAGAALAQEPAATVPNTPPIPATAAITPALTGVRSRPDAA